MAKQSSALQKGSACTNCRRRKIKCDGEKPRCGPCLNSSAAFSDCEYNDSNGLTQVQILEDQISILEARLQDLQSRGPPEDVRMKSQIASTVSKTTRKSNAGGNEQLSASGFEDLPPIVRRILVHNFIMNCCWIGFFLHRDRFINTVLHFKGEAPTFALLNTTYVWGNHLSSSQNSLEQEATLVSRALQSSAHSLSETHPQRVTQFIQAEVLLGNYFYLAGKTVEGRYHVTAAASLVLSAGLHKIRSFDIEQSGYLARALDSLALPRDSVEEGELINAFWTVLTLDSFWNTVHGTPSSIPYTAPSVRIDTPWPLSMEEYAETPLDPNFRSSHTIDNFLSGIPDNADSPRAAFSKAAILFERATFTGRQLKNDPISQLSQADFSILDTLIPKFISSLLPIDRAHVPPLNYQLVINTLANAADIQLHLPFAPDEFLSRMRMLGAAKDNLDLIDTWGHLPEMEFLDPMIAIIWTITAQVFIKEGVRLQQEDVRLQQGDPSNLPFTRAEVFAFAKRVMKVMEVHSFPLMNLQLAQVKKEFEKAVVV
ncbi:Zn(2)-Cys(6) binuclear cluster domain-containing protein [Lentinula detonsa]|uniref:Zn(2)-Cys(6) binuclear cluster domain-containing protein n=1 Tax=Lentinula detonsa TaxID=2804962 RepID=A0AA38Q540_9AGAR|nr:Zn(2)-Cys(6) binuclear cluster domain-containing protein [Lentinula detonsa]